MTSSSKRQRHKEGHRLRMEEARAAQARAQRRRRTVTGAIVAVFAVLVIGAAVVIFGAGGDDSGASDDTRPAETQESTTTSDPNAATTVSLPAPPEGRTIKGKTPCPATDGSEERAVRFAQAPPTCIEEGEDLEAVVETSVGSFTIALDADAAPTMVNNFVVLARYKYFDGLPFHRLIPGFMAQTGSSGDPDYPNGGPGYDMEDIEKPEEGYRYQAGDVAMARSTAVSGSQFFVVATAEGASHLTPEYPRFGRVTEGQEIAAVIAAAGDPAQDGAPTKLVTVESVTIRPAGG